MGTLFKLETRKQIDAIIHFSAHH